MERPQTAQTRLASSLTTGAIRPLLESYRGHFEVVAYVLFFDPFFTTKSVGEGTGLGLDVVRRSVTGRHGGDIRVDSRPGEPRFVVRLPMDPRKIVSGSLAPADAHELAVAENDLLEEASGWALADRNYWSPKVAERLSESGLILLAHYKSARREGKPWSRSLTQKRRRIETVISQMVERYGAKRVWARDRWHLLSRWLRKVLSHTVAVLLCQQAGLPPLYFAELPTD